MKWSIFIFLAILLIMFIPIPIKLTAAYSNNQLCLYIFNFNIKLKKKEKKSSKSNKKKKTSKLPKIDFQDARLLVTKLECLRFKPTLRMKISLNYGLLDASSTGIAYGVLNTFSPFLYKLLTIVFKVKKYDMDVKPNFNELMVAASVNSIIFINLAKIIYIVAVLLKSLKFIKQKKNYAYSNS
ncbi:DUF2953 domain-containing protein [Clostridium swellfunianum]|uniref:DUF2953 domain-containing protein n=1 Tax=Clostridium swellfunianum TaxID=1367462 RepID=UPI00202FC125|nr:DUF2953 domain-containing protein [Clostridium swellfunianum]MCM0648979.1 DUF2953 domain-containing protein [Clostridium swellfunianum]